jgi:hypothetical protein
MCGESELVTISEAGRYSKRHRESVFARVRAAYGFWTELMSGLPFSTMKALMVLAADSGLDSCTIGTKSRQYF